MRYDYVVTLKNDSHEDLDRISLGLCTLSLVAFVFEQLRSGTFSLLLSFAVVVMSAGILIQAMAFEGKKTTLYRYRLLLAGIFWVGMPYLQWLSVFFFGLAILEYQARSPLHIGFSKDSITISTLFRRRYHWSDFSNIILKDGLLTLDFRNNKVFQREILEGVDEGVFNEYCVLKLTS